MKGVEGCKKEKGWERVEEGKDGSGPALGMFEVFGRTGPQNLGGPQILNLKIPYKFLPI